MRIYDIWDLRVFGKEATTGGLYTANFSMINPEWFKKTVKDYIWYNSSQYSTSELLRKLTEFRRFSRYLTEKRATVKPQDIDRLLVIEAINYASQDLKVSKSLSIFITTLKYFFEFCNSNNLIEISSKQLIFESDYPKAERKIIKEIPSDVIKQIRQHLDSLPKPIKIAISILIETGMRISEVCSLKLNCISQDSDGDWWVSLYRIKLKKEDRLFISKELAQSILQQQEFIKNNLGRDFSYLFCSTEGSGWFASYTNTPKRRASVKRELSHFIPVKKLIKQPLIRGYLHQLAHEHNITDISGEIYPVWKCHRFRHTHLTDLARKGMGIAHIMQRGGHASPSMSMHYIHLTNDDQKKKMKEVWDNTHFNMEGEIVAPVNPDLDTAEMQWIKKGMGVQTTDNGYCTLLWTQTCPHQDLPCKSCGSWVTTLDFLDSHKQELKETEKIIENARQKGYQRQIEKNVPRAERLKRIISGMEKHKTMRGLGHNEWEEKE
ncbi:integrase family protein [Stanieria cyanosphaera PCC 7437]|nr:integrase family protein [Stanieria cyanosphaera PCC 7437]